jgi:hypothetical protein
MSFHKLFQGNKYTDFATIINSSIKKKKKKKKKHSRLML